MAAWTSGSVAPAAWASVRFVIVRAGKPVARVTAIESPEPGERKRLGFLAGEFTVPDDFDRMGEEEIADLFGS